MKSRPVVLSVLVGVVISVAWFMFVWSPKQTQLKDSRTAHGVAESETSQLKTKLSQLEDIDAQGPKIDAEVMRLRTYVPKNPELASFLLVANDLAVDSGINWLSITPGAPVADPAGGPSVIAVQVEIEGGFSEMLKYLDGLEKLPRLVIVDDLSVGADGGAATDAEATGAPTLHTTFTARLFTESIPAGTVVEGAPASPDASTAPTSATEAAPAGSDS